VTVWSTISPAVADPVTVPKTTSPSGELKTLLFVLPSLLGILGELARGFPQEVDAPWCAGRKCRLDCCIECKVSCKEDPMQRTCRYVPLSKQPLVLVLCQVRFTPVRRIADYISGIQDDFRRHGYPIERAGKIQQLTITSQGVVQTTEQDRWEYRNKDETTSILVLQDSVVLQTTAYTKFEVFADQLRLAMDTVLSKTEQDNFGLIQRVGMRYIDLVQPRADEGYRFYLRPGFHGVADEVFKPGTHRLHVESIGATDVGGIPGTMVVRISQSDQGSDLPADVVGSAPKHASRAKRQELVTLIDMDHFIEGNFEPKSNWVLEKAYRLHDHLIETLHEHVISPAAVEAWR